MIEEIDLIFPDLICLNEYSGNFENYFEAVYSIFNADFIKSQPKYEGVRVSVKKYPEVDGMHSTFYHITHEGKDENNRQPDIRRMERIRYPKFVMSNHKHREILIWKNMRGGDERVVLYNEIENYVVILASRTDYYIFVTAYFIETKHRKESLLKEYETYIKAKTA